MNILAVIPARYASTRLPGKPLAPIAGKPMIQHVYERVRKAKSVHRVVVATDDERILQAVRDFGGEAVMTRSDHRSGSERVAEVAVHRRLAEHGLAQVELSPVHGPFGGLLIILPADYANLFEAQLATG